MVHFKTFIIPISLLFLSIYPCKPSVESIPSLNQTQTLLYFTLLVLVCFNSYACFKSTLHSSINSSVKYSRITKRSLQEVKKK
mmetsp:Transcript_5831/g.7616  ORF Transcript_5831/g.7616 Transcript_5831/m.7616 type:complete len:83 (+) Transcript_5831:4867-5115(+)